MAVLGSEFKDEKKPGSPSISQHIKINICLRRGRVVVVPDELNRIWCELGNREVERRDSSTTGHALEGR